MIQPNYKNLDYLHDLLDRIILEYPIVAGPNTCPPPPHACSKCEIYYLLDEYQELEKEYCYYVKTN